MQLFCPACQAAFTGLSRCPRCEGLLLMPEEMAALPEPGRDVPAGPEKSTPAARVGVGTVVALGLYLGLRQVTAGWVLATARDADGWWLSDDGLAAVFGLQAAAVLVGALLTGAGRANGFWLGAVVGGACGGLFLAAEVAGGTPVGQLVLLVQPVVLALGGGVAGVVGARVWSPAPVLDMPPPAVKRSSSIHLTADPPEEKVRPTRWARVVLGTAMIVFGVGLAEKVRREAEKASLGVLRVQSRGQGTFVSWQMATLAVLAGGVVAGASTGAGLRHGVYAGGLGAAGVVGWTVQQGVMFAPAAYLLEFLNMSGAGPHDPAALAAVAGGVLLAGLVGGWLGGALFLPLAPSHMRNRRLRVGMD